MTIYERIDEILKLKKMSRRKLAQKAGILEGTLSTAFSRKTKLKYETLKKMAEALDMNLISLVEGTDYAPPADSTGFVQDILEIRRNADYRQQQESKREAVKSYIDDLKDADVDVAARVIFALCNSPESKWVEKQSSEDKNS